MITRFNLRIYGILIRDHQVLVSTEEYEGHRLVKFPGGGVEYGEGLHEALIREWEEEVQLRVEVGPLLYLTEDFIQSAFREEDQVVCFYYQVNSDAEIIRQDAEHEVCWLSLDQPVEETGFTFPQEKKVFQLLRDRFL